MVRRFRPTNFYPSGIPEGLPDNQSSVPSQHSPVSIPFDPSRQPDMQPTKIDSVPDVSIVRAVFDSRPPYAYDFFFENTWQDGVQILNPYTVPVGYVLILRKVEISVYSVLEGDLLNSGFMSPFGDISNAGLAPTLQILIDNLPAPTWTVGAVTLFDIFTSDVEIETFIPILGGSTIDIKMPGVTGIGSTTFNVYAHFYGNMLLATGRNLVNEVGNANPQPVISG